MIIVKLLPLRLRVSKTVIVLGFILFIIFFSVIFNSGTFDNPVSIETLELHQKVVQQFYHIRKSWNISKLGAVLYKNDHYPTVDERKKNRQFVILIWKHWEVLKDRHVYYFSETKHDPLEECSVKNCILTGNDSQLHTADAVVVNLHRGLWPPATPRNRTQKWIFLNDEGPPRAFGHANGVINYEELHNLFNWSMTYSSEADVPVPYGRTVALSSPKFSSQDVSLSKLVPNWKDKVHDTPVASLMSNCRIPYRNKLVNKLKKYVKTDSHGKCGEINLQNSCPGHFKSDCKVMSKYLFYLVFENNKCKEYMTEKLFYNAYYKGAIPIIQGPSIQECETFLPPNSYLHVDKYATIKDLADDIIRISKDDEELLNYHRWRNHFEIANEHGYFGSKSFHLCRLCEAMNYNDDTESVYSKTDLARFFDAESLCRKPIAYSNKGH